MLKKAKLYVPSDTKDNDSSFSEDSSSDEEDTVQVNGFQVLVSVENQVKEMFKNHPDLITNFNLKNKKLKNAYMDVLLDVIYTLTQSTQELPLKDINKADTTLSDLTRAGLKVAWLRQKLDEAYLMKEKQRVSGARIKELEELVKNRKLTLSKLESDLKKEKAAVLSAKPWTGFNDVTR